MGIYSDFDNGITVVNRGVGFWCKEYGLQATVEYGGLEEGCHTFKRSTEIWEPEIAGQKMLIYPVVKWDTHRDWKTGKFYGVEEPLLGVSFIE